MNPLLLPSIHGLFGHQHMQITIKLVIPGSSWNMVASVETRFRTNVTSRLPEIVSFYCCWWLKSWISWIWGGGSTIFFYRIFSHQQHRFHYDYSQRRCGVQLCTTCMFFKEAKATGPFPGVTGDLGKMKPSNVPNNKPSKIRQLKYPTFEFIKTCLFKSTS